MSKGFDKYLQDAEQHHASEVNYFDDTTSPTNIEQITEFSENNLPSAKQEAIEEVESVGNIPESQKIDTGHTSQHPS